MVLLLLRRILASLGAGSESKYYGGRLSRRKVEQRVVLEELRELKFK